MPFPVINPSTIQNIGDLINKIQNARQTTSSIIATDLINFEEAEYYMQMDIAQWNGAAALQMSGLTNAVAYVAGTILAPFGIGLPGLTKKINSFADFLAQFNLQEVLNFPICTTLMDSQHQEWNKQSLVEGISSQVEGVFNTLKSSLPVVGGLAYDAVNAVQVLAGINPNQFLTMMFKGPNFKIYELKWVFSPNSLDVAKTIVDATRSLNAYVAPGLSTKYGSFLWEYPSIFQLHFRKRNGPDYGPFLYKFKPAVCTNLTIDYGGSGIPTFLRGGYPETVVITMSFNELEMWRSTDFDDNWPDGR